MIFKEKTEDSLQLSVDENREGRLCHTIPDAFLLTLHRNTVHRCCLLINIKQLA